MTERIRRMRAWLQSRAYRDLRTPYDGARFADCWTIEDQTRVFREMAQLEEPLLFPDDRIGFHRRLSCRGPHRAGNVSPNYGRIVSRGMAAALDDIRRSMDKTADPDKRAYGEAMHQQLSVCLQIADRWQAAAAAAGNAPLAAALARVPRAGARTFYEALVSLKACIYCLRLYGAAHLTLGRFDQYMYPYYCRSRDDGQSDEELLEQLEEFFLSLNVDTDLYPGIQQGDNGQSMVLGGRDAQGNSVYNALSDLCLQASLELSVIDPKINLRVDKNTPTWRFIQGTQLTKQGLGFPQYCNDDVVIPGLIRLGYAPQDACDYAVAACWEFIIPGCGADQPNVQTMDFPHVVHRAIVGHLAECDDMDSLMRCVSAEMDAEVQTLFSAAERYMLGPMPLLSVFTDGCIENLRDMWAGGAKYLNFGCHGAGIANAADALAAVQQAVFTEKSIGKQQLLDALAANFDGFSDVRARLRACPKMGNNDDRADGLAARLMQLFAQKVNGKPNGRGGIWRAGTGSAMEYIWKGEKCPATADGRLSGEPYSCSFSPSLDVKTDGLLSVIRSFTKFDLTQIINGGPLTIEIHDTVLRNDIGIEKTARLVQLFVRLGGHELQINAVSRERLLEAQKHPEEHPDLIVRVWGWSGYFCELDPKYQNHIIRRCEYTG